jgi:hypothetical protein
MAFRFLNFFKLFRRSRKPGPKPRPRTFKPGLEQLESILAPSTGTGTGLLANYYSDQNLTNLVLTRVDPTVNFTWTGSPGAPIPAGQFSARWTGRVQAQYSELYTFYTDSDDGVRLWVNGNELINNWTNHATTENRGTIALVAGQTYSIKMEFYQNSGGAVARLLWSSHSTAKHAIPTSQLYSDATWLSSNIGSPSLAGSTAISGSSITDRGSGFGLGSTSDQARYVYQPLSGDGSVIAQVTGLLYTAYGARAGVMIRETLNGNSIDAVLTVTAGGGAVFQFRTATGGASSQVFLAGFHIPTWLELVRKGNLIDAYVSSTGADGSWTLVGAATVPMAATVDFGLVVTSDSNSLVSTGTFRNASVKATIPLGANLDGVTDYSLDNAFVNMIKQARQFTSIARSTPGDPIPATVDANGWPTEDFETIIQTGTLNTAKVYNGIYKLSFTGRATVDTSITPGGMVSNVFYNPLTNTTTADITVHASDSSSQWYFVLDFTNTHGGVKNIKLIRPGYALNTTQVFTNQFLSTLQPFSTLRFMDWGATNNNPVANWADRTLVTDARQSTPNGVAWEYMIQLANLTHKDLWINIPVNATDDYVKQLAALLKHTLAPDLVVNVEYSNELWNGQFSQATVNKNAAVAEVVAGMESGHPSNLFYPGENARNRDGTWVHQWDWAFRRAARRIRTISDDFASVWGAGAINNRVRPVLASQFANNGILQLQLQFLDSRYGAPSHYLYAVAGAPYFNLKAVDGRTDLTVGQVIAALRASLKQQIAAMPLYVHWATYYGLRDFAYEAGPDTLGPHNIAAKAAASLDPRMETLVIDFLDAWYANGGGLINWFVAGPTNYNTPYGTWGLTNDITNLHTPKMQGILAVLAGAKPALTVGNAISDTFSANKYVGAAPTNAAYPRYLHNGNTLDYLIRAPKTETYSLQIYYAAPNPNEQLQIIVNNKVVQTLTLAVTGSSYDSLGAPNSFAWSPSIKLNLDEGLDVVRLKVIEEGYTINLLRFTPAG